MEFDIGLTMSRKIFFISMTLAFCLHGLSSFGAIGAEVKAIKAENGRDAISLRGPIEAGDAAKIKRLKNRLPDFRRGHRQLYLNSPGGKFAEALRIVDLVYGPSPIATRISAGAECYSACALIFMAGHTGGGSAGFFLDRKLHFRGKLGFHAPYLKGMSQEFTAEQVYRTAILSLRKLMEKEIVPPSLLVEMLSKGPNESLTVDNVDKAGRWKIDVYGFGEPPITRQMFCRACENHRSWRRDASAQLGSSKCQKDGAYKLYNKDGYFKMDEEGQDYHIKILFPAAREHLYECKILYSSGSRTFSDRPYVLLQFGNRGRDFDRHVKLFYVYPSHYYEPDTPLISLGAPGVDQSSRFSEEKHRISEGVDYGGLLVWNNYDLQGEDLRHFRNIGKNKCEASCKRLSECKAYTYDKWNRWCFLKSRIATLRLEPKAISGVRRNAGTPRRSTAPTKMLRLRGKIFRDKAQSSSRGSSFRACERRCSRKSSCVAFTYFKRPKKCSLFSEVGEYFSNASTDSGFKRQVAR